MSAQDNNASILLFIFPDRNPFKTIKNEIMNKSESIAKYTKKL